MNINHLSVASIFTIIGVLSVSAIAFAAIAVSGVATVGSSVNVTVSQLTITKPTTASAGDVLIATVSTNFNGNSPSSVTPPAGWNLILRTDNVGQSSMLTYWKKVSANEPSTYTWVIYPAANAEGGITPYSGVNSDSPIDTAQGSVGHSAIAIAPAIHAASSSEIIASFTTSGVMSGGGHFSTPQGMNEEYDISRSPTGPSIASSDAPVSLVGAGAKTSLITPSRNQFWVAQQIALRMATTTIVECTGGTVTHVNGKTIHTFTSSGTFNCSNSGSKNVSVLVVGGGGGGGQGAGGGGGGGGVVYEASHTAGQQTYAVTVGNGGTGSVREGAEGTNGEDSSFDTITAKGGGLGGQWDFSGSNGHDGDNGGGAGANFDGAVGGIGTQGYKGGNSEPGSLHLLFPTAGGGGAGGPGQDGISNIGGNGGPGVTNSISGSPMAYGGGGGGGGTTQGVIPGVGGSGGGGAGGGVGGNGAPNTGGGGGGGGYTGFNIGGTGGSGVVIISYPNN